MKMSHFYSLTTTLHSVGKKQSRKDDMLKRKRHCLNIAIKVSLLLEKLKILKENTVFENLD